MQFTEPLHRGRFIKRYKRFFADVEVNGETIVAHVANTGSLKTCLYPDSDCLVTMSHDPKRKLKASLQFLKTPQGWAGINTALPNVLVFEAWKQQIIPEWTKFKSAKREVKISAQSRIDLVLDGSVFIEVKNVTFAEDGLARFPDAVTERGQKHLRELMALKSQGHEAELVFVIQREGCHSFAPADSIDPTYGALLREARAAGVVIRTLPCAFDFENQTIGLKNEPLMLVF